MNKHKQLKIAQLVLWVCLLCLCHNLYAQSTVNEANITFAIGNQRITVADNGDILSVFKSNNKSYSNNNAVVIVDYNGISADVNRDISVWKGSYYPSAFHFPIDKYLLMRHYSSNEIMLDALDELVQSKQIIEALDTIEIIGSCSPVASEEYNLKLALSRCMALRSYLRQTHPQFAESFPVKFKIIGIDRLGYSILSAERPPLTQKQIWDKLQYAAICLKMKDGTCIIPGADRPKRTSGTDTETSPEAVEPICISDTITVFLRDTIYITDTQYILLDKPDEPKLAALPKPLFVALKTNLLYDAALLPNLTVELYLGRQWSVAVEGNCSWWVFGSPVQNQWFHRVQVAGVELRKWVKSPYPLHGHAIGVYGMTGNYDIRLFPKDEYGMGELSRRSWSAGLSYAYAFPISRRFNLELGLAVGYVNGKYYKYNYCVEETQWEIQPKYNPTVYNRNYIGPTRVGASLVWLLGAGNYTNFRNK